MKEIKKNFWKNKKILITGHTGFTGIWLTTLLSNYGAKITGISLDDNTQPAIYKTLKINKKVKNIYIDVANFSSLKEVILKCNAEIIIHLAAQSLVQKSYKYSHRTFLTNTIGTLNLLEILKDNKYVKAIFIATTDKVYLNNEKKKVFMECDALGGDDPYSSSKSSAEIIINSYYKSFFKKKKVGLVTVRAGNIIGGGDWNEDRLIPDLVKNIYLNKKFKLRSLKSTRPWQHVLDVIFIYTSIIKSVYANYKLSGAYNLGPKKSYSVKKILLYLKKKNLFNKVYIYNKNYFAEKNFLSISSKKIFKTFNIKNKINFYKSLELTFNWYKNFYLGINPDKLIDDDLNFYEINFKK